MPPELKFYNDLGTLFLTKQINIQQIGIQLLLIALDGCLY